MRGTSGEAGACATGSPIAPASCPSTTRMPTATESPRTTESARKREADPSPTTAKPISSSPETRAIISTCATGTPPPAATAGATTAALTTSAVGLVGPVTR